MKILVVDDEQRFGALICRSLRRLGHEPLLALHPEDALEMLEAAPDVDAVISDIDMPIMNGVELATAIRARRQDMPIAFCTGSAPRQPVLAEAATLGAVLAAPWTLEDMGGLVDRLQRERARAGAPRRDASVHLTSWDEVQRLCDRRDRGPVRLPVRATSGEDGPITLTLNLPGGFTLAVDGEVVAQKLHPDGVELIVELGGLGPEQTTRLRALAAPAAPPARGSAREQGWESELARASGGPKVSELLLSNERLKAQIAALAAKMRPRGGGGDDDGDAS